MGVGNWELGVGSWELSAKPPVKFVGERLARIEGQRGADVRARVVEAPEFGFGVGEVGEGVGVTGIETRRLGELAGGLGEAAENEQVQTVLLARCGVGRLHLRRVRE